MSQANFIKSALFNHWNKIKELLDDRRKIKKILPSAQNKHCIWLNNDPIFIMNWNFVSFEAERRYSVQKKFFISFVEIMKRKYTSYR